MPRIDRPALLVVEGLALVAAALAPVSMPVLGLLVIGSISVWVRGRSWFATTRAPALLVAGGAAVGAIALALALAISPALSALTGRAVEWSQFAIARGAVQGALVAAVWVTAFALATEMVFRGWVLTRVREIAPQVGPSGAIAIAALLEAAITPGHAAIRIGALAMGVGCGTLFVGGGARLAAPLACRLVFELGSVMLTWLELVR
ncbi:MAG: hypothetical protein K8W52_15585 [Deltaproteobacteria bacterium]|nr:hypothetical protein [Deltaproteobacteria bacterium]